MIFEHLHIADFLEAELRRRNEVNPRYSSNAFAKHIGMSPAFLSLILKKKRRPSVSMAKEVIKGLKLTQQEGEYLLLLAQYDGAQSPHLKEHYYKQVHNLREKLEVTKLTLEHFRFLSDWHHSAVLEVLEIRDHPKTEVSIAKQLGLAHKKVRESLQILINLGLVGRRGETFVRLAGPYISTPHDIANSALRRFHAQILRMAIVALEEEPVEARHISGLTLSIDPEKLPVAKEKIREFVRSLSRDMKSDNKKEVYQLSVSFFKLHEKLNRREK
ncbi:MAG: TIGR02147 family protein [Bdellovibrionales bacterium]